MMEGKTRGIFGGFTLEKKKKHGNKKGEHSPENPPGGTEGKKKRGRRRRGLAWATVEPRSSEREKEGTTEPETQSPKAEGQQG